MARTMYKITVLVLILYMLLSVITVFSTAAQLMSPGVSAGPIYMVSAMGYSVASFFYSLSMMYFVPLLLKRYVPELKEA